MKRSIIYLIISGLILIGLIIYSIPTFSFYLFDESKVLKENIETDILSNDKINVYLFWGKGCPHCKELAIFLHSLNSKYTNYNLYTFEVWHNNDNVELMSRFGTYFNESPEGVPYLIIGDKTFVGYSKEDNKDIEEAILNTYNSKFDAYDKMKE